MAEKTLKDYRCLTCNAKPGELCKRPSGHTVPFGDYHAGRKEMWSFFNAPGAGGGQEHSVAQEAMEGRLF